MRLGGLTSLVKTSSDCDVTRATGCERMRVCGVAGAVMCGRTDWSALEGDGRVVRGLAGAFWVENTSSDSDVTRVTGCEIVLSTRSGLGALFVMSPCGSRDVTRVSCDGGNTGVEGTTCVSCDGGRCEWETGRCEVGFGCLVVTAELRRCEVAGNAGVEGTTGVLCTTGSEMVFWRSSWCLCLVDSGC